MRSRDRAAVDPWLLDQWSSAPQVPAGERPDRSEVDAGAGPVYPASKLYAVADYLMRDSKGRISKRRATETIAMIREHQERTTRGG
jgi:hypothetical protein